MATRRTPLIPAERLTAYQRWELAAVLEPPEPPPAVKAPEPPPPAPEPAAPTIKWPTAEELDALHQEAHREGYAAGYEEGTARVRMEAMQLNSLVNQLNEAISRMESSVADHILHLALEIARQVTRQALAGNPDRILPVVRDALASLPEQHTTIVLHPEDAAVVRKHMPEPLARGEVRVIEDPRTERGGCTLETGSSQIDATVPTRWRRVMEAMGTHDDWLEIEHP